MELRVIVEIFCVMSPLFQLSKLYGFFWTGVAGEFKNNCLYLDICLVYVILGFLRHKRGMS